MPKWLNRLFSTRQSMSAGRNTFDEEMFPRLFLRRLEERRVLAVDSVTAVAGQLSTNEGVLLADVSLATFTDDAAGPNQNVPHRAMIDWGDGTISAGTITEPAGMNPGMVSGSHTYADDGSYTVVVTVAGADDTSMSDMLTMNVSNVAPTLGATPNDTTPDEGAAVTLNGTVSDPGFDFTSAASATMLLASPANVNTGIVFTANQTGTALNGIDIVLTNGETMGMATVTPFDPMTGQLVIDIDPTMTTANKIISAVNAEGTFTASLEAFFDPTNDGTGVVNAMGTVATTAGGTDTDESFTAQIDWGDGTVETVAVTETPGSPGTLTSGVFTGAHAYADDGSYQITVRLWDDDMAGPPGMAGVDFVEDTIAVTVGNVAPGFTSLTINNTSMPATVMEGSTVTLGAAISDPGFDNATAGTMEDFFAQIDWGDGTIEMVMVMETPGGAGMPTTGMLSGTHEYADDGNYTVAVRVWDDDMNGPTGAPDAEFVENTIAVTVVNAPPMLMAMVDNASPDEGSAITLNAVFSDPGFDFASAATATIILASPNNVNTGIVLTANQTGTALNGVDIVLTNGETMGMATVTPFDPMTGQLVIDIDPTMTTANTIISAVNAEGTFTASLETFFDPTNDGTGVVNAMGTVATTAGGTVTDESFTAQIDWGDGTVELIAVTETPGGPGTLTSGVFTGAHVYADDGSYQITVRLWDDDMAGPPGMAGVDFVEDTVAVTVVNVAPSLMATISETTPDEGETVTVNGAFTDPGFDSTTAGTMEDFSAQIDWGDGTVEMVTVLEAPGGPLGGTSGSFSGSHQYADDGNYTVTVRLWDDDMMGPPGMAGVDFVEQTFAVTVGNVAPMVAITVSNTSPDEGETVTVNGMLTDPGFDDANAGTTESFTVTIDWGDGTTDAIAVVKTPGSPGTATTGAFTGSHVYADNGNYMVAVRVWDDDMAGPPGMAGSDFIEQTFAVAVANVAPTLNATISDNMPQEGQTVTVSAMFSDPGFDSATAGTMESFFAQVDWGDGTVNNVLVTETSGGPGMPTTGMFTDDHVYAAPGNFTVTVRLWDDDMMGPPGMPGADFVQQSFNVMVQNANPTITQLTANGAAPPATIDEGGTVALAAMFADPGFAIGQGYMATIDWGDNTTDGAAVALTVGGPNVPTTGSFSGAHVYADNGVYTVTATVIDGFNGVGMATFDVTVNNVAPSLSASIGAAMINEGESITASGDFTDPGFDSATAGTSENFFAQIDWGDGTVESIATVETPGGAGVATAGTLSGNHTYADNGSYTVRVRVWDDDMAGPTGMPGAEFVEQSFLVTVVNVAPVLAAMLDAMNVTEGTTVNLSGSLADPGFDSASAGTSEDFFAQVDWGDGTVSTLAVSETPGAPGVATTGAFGAAHVYADNSVAPYVVRVRVWDDDMNGPAGTAGVDFTEQVFMVTVTNVAPGFTSLAIDGESMPAPINEGSTVTLGATISDPGFDSPTAGTMENFFFTIDWGDIPVTATAAVMETNSASTPSTGSIAAAHTYADNGQFSVIVRIWDDDMLGPTGMAGVDFIQQVVVITVNNVAPSLTGLGDEIILKEGELFSLSSLGLGIADPGFDNPDHPAGATVESFPPPTYMVDWGDGTAGQSGAAVNRTSGADGVPTTAGFEVVAHAYADNGTYTVQVTLVDDDGGTTTQSFTIIVENVAPTVTALGSQTVDEGALLSLVDIVTITDPGFDGPPGTTSETLFVQIVWGDGTFVIPQALATLDVPGAQGVLTQASFDAAHVYADNGPNGQPYTVRVRVWDDDMSGPTGTPDAQFVEQTISVAVNNVPPTIVQFPTNVQVDENGFVEFTITFADPGMNNPFNPLVPPDGSVEEFSVFVNWNDSQQPGEEEIMVSTAGAVPLQHTYVTAPNPLEPAADFVITFRIRDDDQDESMLETTTASVPGEGLAIAFVPPESDIPTMPLLTFQQVNEAPPVRPVTQNVSQPLIARAARAETGGDVTITKYVLRIVTPAGELAVDPRDGAPREVELSEQDLRNLNEFFQFWLDGQYRVYLQEARPRADGEGAVVSERMILEVFIRGGELDDPSDNPQGEADRATSDAKKGTGVISAGHAPVSAREKTPVPFFWGVLTAAPVVYRSRREWQRAVDRAMSRAGDRFGKVARLCRSLRG